jgi:hypothetical protein
MSDKDRAKEEAAKQAAYEKEMAPYREQSKRDQEREKIIQDAIKKGVKFDEQDRVKMAKGGDVKKNWIANAVKKPGALRQSLGVKKGEKIPAKKLAKATKAPGKMGQRARLAETLKGFSRGGGIESRGKTRGKIV